jgi:hypothetical protein
MKTAALRPVSGVMRATLTGLVALTLGVVVTAADAQQPKIEDAAAARALFDEARQLASSGKYADACPKFEESQRLSPGIGTLFNLADCFEHIGKTASAWTLFLDVASQARGEKQADREKIARQRADALRTSLPKLSIVLAPGADVQGLDIKRDGSPVSKPMWGTPVPIDPGNHTVAATAPGRKIWQTSVQVKGDGATLSVTVPVLDAEGGVAPVSAPPPSAALAPAAASSPLTPASQPTQSPPAPDQGTSGGGSTQKTIGLIVGGAGIVGLGVGTFFGLASKSKMNQSSDYCSDNGDCWDQKGVDLRSDAVNKQTLAYVTGGVGAAALIGGAVLFLTAPSSPSAPNKASSQPKASVAVGPGQLIVHGSF